MADDAIETRFAELVNFAAESLSPPELDEVLHFVNVDEFGLALETLIDIYGAEGKAIGADVRRIALELASEMGLQESIPARLND